MQSFIVKQQSEQVKNQLSDSLIPYDRLSKWSEQSVVKILNDDSEQLHGLPLVAAWASDDESLLNYFIKCVNNGDFVTRILTVCNILLFTLLPVSIR